MTAPAAVVTRAAPGQGQGQDAQGAGQLVEREDLEVGGAHARDRAGPPPSAGCPSRTKCWVAGVPAEHEGAQTAGDGVLAHGDGGGVPLAALLEHRAAIPAGCRATPRSWVMSGLGERSDERASEAFT